MVMVSVLFFDATALHSVPRGKKTAVNGRSHAPPKLAEQASALTRKTLWQSPVSRSLAAHV